MGLGNWMQKSSEGAPAKTQGREDGGLPDDYIGEGKWWSDSGYF